MENAAMGIAPNAVRKARQRLGSKSTLNIPAQRGLGAKSKRPQHLINQQDRRLVFEVVATDEKGEIGRGTHERFIVDKAKFMSKL